MQRSADLPLTIRPVVALENHYPAGFVDPYHCHHRAQLTFTVSGVVSVATRYSSFVLPPNRAVWLPAGAMHQVRCGGPASLNALYLDPDLPEQPREFRVFEVSDLVRALIREVLTFDHAYDIDGREGRIVSLLLQEIRRMPAVPLQSPMPRDPRLRRVCEIILVDPGDRRVLEDWARIAAMGRRTFTRAFRRETGMTLASWRQQVRLLAALSLLSEGRPVTSVAYEVGYESPSAFTAIFHRTFGVPPSLYGAS